MRTTQNPLAVSRKAPTKFLRHLLRQLDAQPISGLAPSVAGFAPQGPAPAGAGRAGWVSGGASVFAVVVYHTAVTKDQLLLTRNGSGNSTCEHAVAEQLIGCTHSEVHKYAASKGPTQYN